MFLYQLFVLYIGLTNADEIFTSMTDIEQLLKVEDVLISSLKTFITNQDAKLNSLQKYKFRLQIKEILKNFNFFFCIF